MSDNIKKTIKENNVKFVRLQFADINGQVKNATVPTENIDKALENNMMLDGSSIKGFRNIETSDMYLIPDTQTFRILPWCENDGSNVARLICDVYNTDGKPFEGCPRSNLKRIIKSAENLGFTLKFAPEIEFFLFEKDKEGKIIAPVDDNAGYYDSSSSSVCEDVRNEIVKALQLSGIEIESSHHEIARGQHEIDFKYAPPLESADNIVSARVIAKNIAEKHNLHATFMPKPVFGKSGSGMHTNIILYKDGKNAFHDSKNPYKLSDNAIFTIGGILKNIKGISAITNPLINSYKRLVPGYDAPVYLAWSLINRSALLRVPSRRGEDTRLELRSPDPSTNPYLAFAVIIESALDGIKNKIEPPSPVEENIYKLSSKERKRHKIDSLPNNLSEALEHMDKSVIARTALGEHIYNEFMSSKRKEWDSFRKDVSQWELDNYLTRY